MCCTSKNLSWTCLERATSEKTLRRGITRRALRWTNLTYSIVRPQPPTGGANTRSPLVYLLLLYANSHNLPHSWSLSLLWCFYAFLSGACSQGVVVQGAAQEPILDRLDLASSRPRWASALPRPSGDSGNLTARLFLLGSSLWRLLWGIFFFCRVIFKTIKNTQNSDF